MVKSYHERCRIRFFGELHSQIIYEIDERCRIRLFREPPSVGSVRCNPQPPRPSRFTSHNNVIISPHHSNIAMRINSLGYTQDFGLRHLRIGGGHPDAHAGHRRAATSAALLAGGRGGSRRSPEGKLLRLWPARVRKMQHGQPTRMHRVQGWWCLDSVGWTMR